MKRGAKPIYASYVQLQVSNSVWMNEHTFSNINSWMVFSCVSIYIFLVNNVKCELAGPSFKLSTIGIRAFPVAAAKIWNALPDNVVSHHPSTHFGSN